MAGRAAELWSGARLSRATPSVCGETCRRPKVWTVTTQGHSLWLLGSSRCGRRGRSHAHTGGPHRSPGGVPGGVSGDSTDDDRCRRPAPASASCPPGRGLTSSAEPPRRSAVPERGDGAARPLGSHTRSALPREGFTGCALWGRWSRRPREAVLPGRTRGGLCPPGRGRPGSASASQVMGRSNCWTLGTSSSDATRRGSKAGGSTRLERYQRNGVDRKLRAVVPSSRK